jgi:hypothetical protein
MGLFDAYDANNEEGPKEYKGAFGTYTDVRAVNRVARNDQKGLENPWLDPVTAFAAPAGGTGIVAGKAAAKLVGAGLSTAGSAARSVITRAGVAGLLSTGAEFALDVPARMAGELHPMLDPLVRIGGGITSGITAERYIDNLIASAVESRQAGKVFKNVIDDMRKTKTVSEIFFKEEQDIIDQATRGDAGAFKKLVDSFRETALTAAETKFAKPLAAQEAATAMSDDALASLTTKVENKIATGGNLHPDDLADMELLATVTATKEYTEGFEAVKKASILREATEEFEQMPVTKMYKWMKENDHVIDPHELRSSGFTEVQIRNLQKKYPGIFEVNTDAATGLLKKMDSEGWTSVSHMMKDFSITPTFNAVKSGVTRRTAEHWAKLFREEISLRAAETQAKWISRAYGYNTAKVFKTVAKIDPRTLVGKVLNEAKGGKKTTQLLTKGTEVELKAARAKHMQEIATLRQNLKTAVDIRKTRKALLDVFNTKTKGLSPEYQEQLRYMLRHTVDKKAVAPEKSMFQFIADKSNEMLGFSTVAERYNRAIQTSMAKPFKELTLDEMHKLRDFVESFRLAAKADQYVNNATRKLLRKHVTDQIADTLTKNYGNKYAISTQKEVLGPKGGVLSAKWDKIRRNTRQFDAFIARMEPIIKQLDGFADNGIAWKTMFRPFVDAERLETAMADATFGKLRDAFAEHGLRTRGYQKIVGKLDGYDVSHESALMMYLNYGTKNADNIKALSLGLNMKPKDIGKFLDEVITPEDRVLAEKVWDIFDEMFAAMSKTHREQTGLTLQKVKGRYFPIVRDSRMSKIVQSSDKNISENMVDYMLRRDVKAHWRKVETGQFIGRRGGVAHLRLDLDTVTKHVQDVAHGVTHWGPVNDVQRITKSSKFKKAVIGNLGEEVYREFDPWLQNLSRPYTVDNPLMRRLRVHTTVGMLGLAPTTALKQTLSGISAIPKVGARNMMGSMKDLLTNPWGFFREAYEMSPALAHRRHTWQREVAEYSASVHGRKRLIMSPKVMDAYFSMIHTMDAVTSTAVWRAGYNKSMTATGGNVDEAIRYADEVVRATQPASLAKDLPRIMRSGEGQRALTMFYSYYSVLHNQARTLIQRGAVGDASVPDVILGLSTMMILPMIAWEVAGSVANTAIGREDDVDLGKATVSGVLQGAAGVPVVRDLVSSAIYGFDYEVSPMVRPIELATKIGAEAVKQATDEDEELTRRDVLNMIEAVGYAFKLPTRTLMNGIDAYYKNTEGEIDDPLAYLFKPPREEE